MNCDSVAWLALKAFVACCTVLIPPRVSEGVRRVLRGDRGKGVSPYAPKAQRSA